MNRMVVVLALSALLFSLKAGAAPIVPEGFEAKTVATELDAAAALAIAPDGRVFIAEQTGKVRIVKNDEILERPALDLGERLDTWWERGLLGITLHPDFPASPFAYLVYVAKDPHTHHVVSRFTVVGDSMDAQSELVLIRASDQSQFKATRHGGHQGGPICFGKDGMLYIGLGELTAKTPSQSLDTLYGKILRIRPDGQIPEDNPFYEEAKGANRAIYALGIRNPFGLASDAKSGRLYETEVGSSAFEEINWIEAGENYGWPSEEGMADNRAFKNPVHAYPPAIGRSICGGLFYPRDGQFPEAWKGLFFFADWAANWVQAIDPDEPSKRIPFARGLQAPVALAASAKGDLYILNRNTIWRDGKKFKERSGSLIRVRYLGGEGGSVPATRLPETFTGTGYAEAAAPLKLASGFQPLELNHEPWRPGIQTQRWIRVPEAGVVTPHPSASWEFPVGTVVIERHQALNGAPHEFHVYTVRDEGIWDAAAYRWNPDAQDADLVETTEIVFLPGEGNLKWLSPGPVMGWDPELAIVGFLLPLTSRQLNAGDQLPSWRELGWLAKDDYQEWPRLVALEDESAQVQERVRSYLDANCASCHRPGGPSRGAFDARYLTPLPKQQILHGSLISGDMGVPGSKVVIPGEPELSALYLRLARKDALRMPPVEVNAVASPVLPLMKAWITGLATSAKVEAEPEIQVWYGPRQSFGHLGHTQRWVNILGHVNSSNADLVSLTYRLNGGEPQPLTTSTANPRLALDGDFNVEIHREDLRPGVNEVELAAVFQDETQTSQKVIVDYQNPETPWPLPYEIDWQAVEMIEDAVQVVDGHWQLTEQGVRTVTRHYDRVLAFGDETWTDYEVTTSIILHSLTPPKVHPNRTNVTHAAIALRWPGHDPDGKQPSVKWHPVGATGEFRLGGDLKQCRWRIFDGKRQFHVESEGRRELEFETLYHMKHRVETLADGRSLYRVKLWGKDDAEPDGWDLERYETGDLTSGSALLIAHFSDVTFGNVKVVSLKD